MFFFTLLTIIDQSSKYLIRQWGGFYICNPNIAFGIKINTIVFYILWILIISTIFISANSKLKITKHKQIQNPIIPNSKWFWISDLKHSNLFGIWDLGFGILLIISGAFSNILDRLYFGCVIDFIQLPYWPAFNLADAFIVIGVIISVVKILNSKF